ncbi:hypothetical protein BH09BAC2_BH09BAC2_11510 [soil metagenome]
MLLSLCVFSQADSILAPYLQFPTVPQFSIYNVKDSSIINRNQLKKRKPVVFIFFSPDCEHCQKETADITANLKKFKGALIVMVTWLPYTEMTAFYKTYNIRDYPQIMMGRDARFYLPSYFKVSMLPAIYIYDKNWKFKNAFSGSVSIDKITADF